MEKNLINSLKRLERVGSETSKATTKLKAACEDVASELKDILFPLVNDYEEDIVYNKIANTKLYVIVYGMTKILCYDYDNKLNSDNMYYYNICPTEDLITRVAALEFAKAVSEGLLEKVADYVEKKNAEMKSAITELEKLEEIKLEIIKHFPSKKTEDIKNFSITGAINKYKAGGVKVKAEIGKFQISINNALRFDQIMHIEPIEK